MDDFRFQDFWIWQEACRLGDLLDEISDQLEAARKYRYAEQLRAAALSVSNNIAEGSGSDSDRDFRHFLNIARRSVYENVNIVLFLRRKGAIDADKAAVLIEDHRVLAAKISRFRDSL
jgi:four helix bundle protein